MGFRAIRSGELRHSLTLQSRVRTRSAQGGFTYTWNGVRTIHAAITPKTGNETFFGEAVVARATHFIRTRVQTETITPDMRLVFGTRVFNILQALNVDEMGHELQIAVIENLSVSEDATGTTDLQTTYQTDEIDFTTVQQITKSFPSGRYFYADSFEIICTTAGGTVVTQPTITLGISGNATKYISRTPTLITAANKRQGYSGLSANDGETALILGISGAGAISAGTYRGILLVKGVLK